MAYIYAIGTNPVNLLDRKGALPSLQGYLCVHERDNVISTALEWLLSTHTLHWRHRHQRRGKASPKAEFTGGLDAVMGVAKEAFNSHPDKAPHVASFST